MARLINTPSVVLQEPETGLDIFLKEIARYASPEYQLRKKESDARLRFAEQEENRANARLELSERSQRQSELQYQNKLKEDIIDNRREDEKWKQQKSVFDLQMENTFRARAKENTSSFISGLNAKDIASINVDAYTTSIDDPKERSLTARLLNKEIGKANVEFENTNNFIKNWNNNPLNVNNQMSFDDGSYFINNPTLYAEHLNKSYLSQGDLTDIQKNKISLASGNIARNSKTLYDYKVKEAEAVSSGIKGVDFSSDISDLEEQISDDNKIINKILGIKKSEEGGSSSSGDGDPYDEEGDKTLSSSEPLIYRDRWQDTALSDMFNYDNLFSDELDVSDNAVSMAINNATTKDSEGNAVEYILDDNVGKSELEDMLAKAKEDGTQEEISFLQNQLSGLSSTQGSSEGKKTSSSSSNLDLFSNQEKSKDFSLKEPPAKLKDARVGIKDFRKLLKDFKWNSKMVSRKTSRPKQGYQRLVDRDRKKLKEMFSKIYDKDSKSFYDDKLERIDNVRERFPHLKEKPLKYREFLTTEELKTLLSL